MDPHMAGWLAYWPLGFATFISIIIAVMGFSVIGGIEEMIDLLKGFSDEAELEAKDGNSDTDGQGNA